MPNVGIYVNGLRWEWFRLSRRVGFWATIGMLGLAVAATLVVTGAMRFVPVIGQAPPAYGFPHAVSDTLSSLGPFLGVVLAGFIFGGEFGWGTWRTSLARGIAPGRLILTKVALGGLVLLAAWLIAWVFASVVGLAFGGEHAALVIVQSSDRPAGWGEVAIKFASAWPAAVAYLALGSLLCIVGRSTAFGVGVGIAIIVVEIAGYPFANALAELLRDVSLDEYIRWTLRGASRGLGGNEELNAAVFLPVLLAYIGAFCWLMLVIFNRRDLDSGNG